MPPVFSALDALLFRDWEQEVWRSYQAGVMRGIANSLGVKKLPTYEECITVDNTPTMTQEEAMEKRRRLLEKLNAG